MEYVCMIMIVAFQAWRVETRVVKKAAGRLGGTPTLTRYARIIPSRIAQTNRYAP